MSYSFEGRIRYSETDEKGYLTLPGVLDYFQDCCTFHAKDVGLGGEVLKERNLSWVLSAWQVVVNRFPKMGEQVVTSTWPYDFHGFIGMRNFTMDTKEGERLAYANSFWTNLDIVTGHPKKLAPEDIAGYELENKLDMEYAPRKIKLPEEWEEKEAFLVQKHHLDSNHHVNNCQYVRMAAEYLPEGFVIGQLRVEYRCQARLDDLICPRVGVCGGRPVVALDNGQQQTYAVVEFTNGETIWK